MAIDIVGLRGRHATVVGEVRWRADPMDVGIVGAIDRYKAPALTQAGIEVGRPAIVLVSRSGFTDGLRGAAARDKRKVLVDPETLAQDPARG